MKYFLASIRFSFILIVFFLISIGVANAQRTTPIGLWKTIDDETKKAKAIVEIYEKEDKLFGKVIRSIDPKKKDDTCTACDPDDPRYNKPIVGMEIVKDLKKDDDEYDNGTILDPRNGKVYSCKMWLEDGQLKIRGYLGFSLIGRSQTWLPYDEK